MQPTLLDSFFTFLLKDVLQKHQIAELIILTSSFAHEQHAIDEIKFRHVVNDNFRLRHAETLANVDLSIEWRRDAGQVIHGGGFALQLWQAAVQHQLPVCLFFKFVSEGDNCPDAVQVLGNLDQLLNGQILCKKGLPSVKAPVSWEALYGNNPTEQLY